MLNPDYSFVRPTAMLAAVFITGLALGWFLQPVQAQSTTGGTGARSDAIIRLQAQVDALDIHVTNLEMTNINLHQQIAYLQNADQGLQEQVNKLEIPTRTLQEQADNLQKQIAALEASNRDLQERTSNLQNQVVYLNSLKEYVTDLQGLYGEVRSVASSLNSMRSEISSLYSEIGSLRSSVNSFPRR
jgi:chromosome segregation ATPase